jgi:protein-disulfide isomerase
VALIGAIVKRVLRLLSISICLAAAVRGVLAQAPAAKTPAPAAVAALATNSSPGQKKVEAFLRNIYALGPEVTIAVGAPQELGNTGLMETAIDVTTPEGSEKVKMYLTKDGRYLLRGELSDLTKDPLADIRGLIATDNAPVLGDPKAPITLVEYSDFQCPVCRTLHDALRGMLPNYPQVKVVFKDFPLETLHPWARTAALAGRCAYQQDPKAFWKMYDLIYDNQDLISAPNVYDKVMDFAGQAGLNKDAFKACLSGPQAAAEVDANVANGNKLDVRSTPTIFVNGRRIVGPDAHMIQQYIDYELAQLVGGKK